MLAGVSSASLYPLPTEEAVRTLAELGVKNAEIFFNDFSELDGAVFSDILRTVKSSGMNVVSVHPFGTQIESFFLFHDYERRRTTALELYKRHFDRMNRLGARYFVIHGAVLSANCSDERYFRQYERLLDAADDFGVTVLQENVCYCKSGSPDFLLRLREVCGGRVKFVLDVKQAVRSGASPYELARLLGRDIAHVHISDNGPAGDCLPIGKGTFDFPRLFSILRENGFDGALLIELYRKNYGSYQELADGAAKIEEILDSMGFSARFS